MRVALTGAGGFVGRALARRLSAVPVSTRGDIAMPPVDAVVHLAGEPIAQRWSADAKRRIRESRVDATRRLVESLARLSPRPAVLVSASAVGIYGSRGDEILIESSTPGDGFLAEVCVDWERAAAAAESLGIRVVTLRIGMVLGRNGGALARMLPAFRMGAGGKLGSGRQWMSWIHLDDLTALIGFALANNALQGPVNATAPTPVLNAEFTETLARTLRRPAFATVPEYALRVVFGEMASVLFDSQRVIPDAAQKSAFSFRYPELAPALAAILA